MPPTQYWIYKSEPETYSIDDLQREGQTGWNGVRNFQARNFLRDAKVKDLVLIYHSGKQKALVGIAEVTRPAYPDPTKNDEPQGEWVQVDLRYRQKLDSAVTLGQLKADSELKHLLLVKQSRLSVSPLSKKEFERVLEISREHESR